MSNDALQRDFWRIRLMEQHIDNYLKQFLPYDYLARDLISIEKKFETTFPEGVAQLLIELENIFEIIRRNHPMYHSIIDAQRISRIFLALLKHFEEHKEKFFVDIAETVTPSPQPTGQRRTELREAMQNEMTQLFGSKLTYNDKSIITNIEFPDITIDGYLFSRYALQRLMLRGIPPSQTIATIQRGRQRHDKSINHWQYQNLEEKIIVVTEKISGIILSAFFE